MRQRFKERLERKFRRDMQFLHIDDTKYKIVEWTDGDWVDTRGGYRFWSDRSYVRFEAENGARITFDSIIINKNGKLCQYVMDI